MENSYASAHLASSSPLHLLSFPPKTWGVRFRNPTKYPTFPIVACNLQSKNGNDRVRSTNRMFILGIGFAGQLFAEMLKNDNWEVSGTCTSAVKKKKLDGMGFDVQLFKANGMELGSLTSLVDTTHLLVSIPPVIGLGDPVLYHHRDLLQSSLRNRNLQWLGYLSSTSVYGDSGGAWVNEDCIAKPKTDSARARLLAEEGWLSLGHDLGVSVQVFRLGGIYGPGRSALDTIIKQKLLTESQRMREARRYTSRVHVADICQVLKASIDMPSFGRRYNVVDDDPAPRAEVFEFAEALVEKRWPGLIKTVSSSSISGSVIQEKPTTWEKRVSNARVKNELGVRLIHPTYKSGLNSIIKSMESPFE